MTFNPPIPVDIPCEVAATQNRITLDIAAAFAVNISGPAGCGKTSLIEATLRRLEGVTRVGVIVANLAAGRDAERLESLCSEIVHLETAIPDARDVQDALARMRPSRLDLILIETAADPRSPSNLDLGEDNRVSVFSASGGDDKAAEYPALINGTSLVLLNKIDLLPYVDFNLSRFAADVFRIDPFLSILQLSTHTSLGMDKWINWLDQQRIAKTAPKHSEPADAPATEWWFG